MARNVFSEEIQSRQVDLDGLKGRALHEDKVAFRTVKEYTRFWMEGVGRQTKEKVRKDMRKALYKGEIPIGYTDRYFEGIPITLDMRHRICVLIAAKLAGSGKTVLGGNIIEQIMNKIDCHVVLFDSKPEFSDRRFPNTDPAMVQKLWHLNRMMKHIKPQGWPNISTVVPMFIVHKNEGDNFGGGETIRYDINEMEFSDILTLFDVNANTITSSKQINKLNMGAFGLQTEEEFQEALTEGTLDDREIITSHELVNMFHPKGQIKDDALKTNLYSMLKGKVIGKSTKFDIVDLLNKDRNVQYVTKTAGDIDLRAKLLAYISVELKRITRARYAHVREQFAHTKKKLPKPVVLYFTEYQTVYPRDPYQPETKREITKIYDQDRFTKINLIADTADIKKVHLTALKQSDYILAFKLDGRDIKHMIAERNITYDQELQLLELDADKDNHPFECAIIPADLKQEAPLQTFYPLPPMSAIQKEQEIRERLDSGLTFDMISA